MNCGKNNNFTNQLTYIIYYEFIMERFGMIVTLFMLIFLIFLSKLKNVIISTQSIKLYYSIIFTTNQIKKGGQVGSALLFTVGSKWFIAIAFNECVKFQLINHCVRKTIPSRNKQSSYITIIY